MGVGVSGGTVTSSSFPLAAAAGLGTIEGRFSTASRAPPPHGHVGHQVAHVADAQGLGNPRPLVDVWNVFASQPIPDGVVAASDLGGEVLGRHARIADQLFEVAAELARRRDRDPARKWPAFSPAATRGAFAGGFGRLGGSWHPDDHLPGPHAKSFPVYCPPGKRT